MELLRQDPKGSDGFPRYRVFSFSGTRLRTPFPNFFTSVLPNTTLEGGNRVEKSVSGDVCSRGTGTTTPSDFLTVVVLDPPSLFSFRLR